MPYIPHTPESLLSLVRSDSKDPATTCRGITSSGRPCRRSLRASSPENEPNSRQKPSANGTKVNDGVLAILSGSNGNGKGNGKGIDSEEVAAFFCWQHKDQAEQYAQRLAATRTSQQKPGKHSATGNKPTRPAKIVSLQERTSIDTLVERLHGVNISGQHDPQKHHQRPSKPSQNATPRPSKPTTSSEKASTNKPSRPSALTSTTQHSQNTNGSQPSKPHPRSLLSILCSASRPSHQTRPSSKPPKPAASATPSHSRPHGQGAQANHTASPQSHGPSRPHIQHMPSSHTECLLSFIPRTLSPQTTSVLLTELAKPISPNDEAGYIYIFWLTTGEDASSRKPGGKATKNPPKTILLKIGRANNVHRRMNEWSRQCSYNLTLVRYYPYVPTAGSDLAPPMSRSMHLDPTDANQHSTDLSQFPDPDLNPTNSASLFAPFFAPNTPLQSPAAPAPGSPPAVSVSNYSYNPTTSPSFHHGPYSNSAAAEYYFPSGYTHPSQNYNNTHSHPSYPSYPSYPSSPALPSPYSFPYQSHSPHQYPTYPSHSSYPHSDPALNTHPNFPSEQDESPFHASASSPGLDRSLPKYTNATTADPSNLSGRKVPHVHRVERLIHIELGAQRVTNAGACAACGREHREWFQVEASREGLRRVDGVIRRWVSWAEQQRGRG